MTNVVCPVTFYSNRHHVVPQLLSQPRGNSFVHLQFAASLGFRGIKQIFELKKRPKNIKKKEETKKKRENFSIYTKRKKREKKK